MAVLATSCSGYIARSCAPPTSCVNWRPAMNGVCILYQNKCIYFVISLSVLVFAEVLTGFGG